MKSLLMLSMKTVRKLLGFALVALCATYIYVHILEVLSKWKCSVLL